MLIALASILYGSVMAFTQTNVRLIAGYSSIAQLGFITLGIFSLRPDGADGAVLQMVNHGLVVAGDLHGHRVVLARTRTEDMSEMGGLAMRAPVLAALFLIVALANLAMPGLGQLHRRVLHPQRRLPVEDRASPSSPRSGSRWPPSTPAAVPGVMHNRLPEGVESREIGCATAIVLAPLVAVIVALALYPGLILERGEASVDEPSRPPTAGRRDRRRGGSR